VQLNHSSFSAVMENSNLEVLGDMEVVSLVVLLKNVSFGNFLVPSCSFAFRHLAYPLSKECFIV
jgi:hypothetical protein